MTRPERIGREGAENLSNVLPDPNGKIEEHHLEAAIQHMAFFVMQYGEALVPLFEQFERDLAELRSRRAPIDRIRKIVESHTVDGGMKAIR